MGSDCSVKSGIPRANQKSPIGVQVTAPGGTNWVFVDVMKMARAWTSIWDRDRDAGQFSYQKGTNSLVYFTTQYQWGNGG